MQRYEKIMTISDSLYQKNCPIIFVKGALLKDNKLNKNILQLQFKNLGLNICKAVYVSIECSDIENKKIEIIEKKYIDLELKYSSAFGENIPIELSSDLSRKFQINIDKIIFKDDSIVEYSGGMCVIEAPDDLKELNDLKNQFIREVEKDNRITRCTVKPTVIKGLWYCTCGALNHSTNDKCGMCKIDREKLFSFLNTDFLQEQNNEYLRQKEIEENERKLQEEKRLEELRQQEEAEKEKKKKHKKILIVLVIIAIMLTALYGLAIKFVVPAIKYSSAIEKIENSDYEEAYAILEELGDYRDSEKQLIEVKYLQGKYYLQENDVENAVEIFMELKDYKDSKELYLQTEYGYICSIIEKNPQMAIEYFENEGKNYPSAKQHLLKAKYYYLIINYEITAEKYKIYYEYLNELIENEYKDAKEIYDGRFPKTFIIANYNKDDIYTEYTELTVSKSQDIYFHIVKFGEPIRDVEVMFEDTTAHVYTTKSLSGGEDVTGTGIYVETFVMNESFLKENFCDLNLILISEAGTYSSVNNFDITKE